MIENTESLKARLELIIEGMLLTQYADVPGLPAHLKEEGLRNRKLYLDMLEKIIMESQ